MELRQEHTLPNELKRGAVTAIDRKMVYKNITNGKYNILFSSAETDKLYLAHVYYQSNIALRIMSRLVEQRLFTSTQMTDGVITSHLESIVRNGWSNTFKRVAPSVDLSKFERLIFKCYRYSVLSGDFFGLMSLVKSYCLEVVKVPEVQLKAYLDNGVKWRGTSKSGDIGLYDLDRLFYSTEAFESIPDGTMESWRTYLINYVADVKYEEKLLAIRDRANEMVAENGEIYNFLVKACKELLL